MPRFRKSTPIRSRCIALLASFILIVGPIASATVNGPSYTPPFQVVSGDRLIPELDVKDYGNIAMPWFQCGNKRVTLRERDGKLREDYDNQFGITINDQEVCRLTFASRLKQDGKYQSASPAPFGPSAAAEFKVNREAQTITFTKPYTLPDGKNAVFTYRLQADGPGKLALLWDLGISQEVYQQYSQGKNDEFWLGLNFAFVNGYRTVGVVSDVAKIQLASAETLVEQKRSSQRIKAATSLQYNPLNPLESFTLHFPQADLTVNESLNQYKSGDAYLLHIQSAPAVRQAQGKLVIDLLQSAQSAQATPPPVESFDFWAEDAIHFPTQPSRNMLPNPSFEQGLRYWKWGTGGASYTPSEIPRYQTVAGGLFGKHMLAVNPVQTRSLGMASFSIPSKKGQWYTLSYYAKAAEGGKIVLHPFSTQANGKFTRSMFGNAPMQDLSPDWKRYTFSFEGDGRMHSLWLKFYSKGVLHIDGMQLEKGKQVTDFVAPPLEGNLSTSDVTNNVEYGTPIRASLDILDHADTQGTVELTLRDLYQAVQYHASFDVSGDTRIPLPFDSEELGTGAYSLQVNYQIPGSAPYDDYFRFSIVKSLNGTHKTRTLFAQLFNARTSRSNDLQALLQRYGFGGATTYGSGKARDPEGYKLREEFGVLDYLHSISENPLLFTEEESRQRFANPDFRFWATLRRTWLREEEKVGHKMLDHYDEETLRKVEETAERVARENPNVRVWSFSGEEEAGIPTVQERNFKEYAKIQEATYRGVKKGNPDALVLPSGGTSGYSSWRGADVINGYLDATKDTVRWDAIAVHPYGAADGTIGFDDLDEVIRLLRDNMAERGYGEETPIFFTEGGMGTTNTTFKGGNTWDYTGGHISYDFGLREFVNSSLLARSYLICLKYWPQLETYNVWWDPTNLWIDQELTLTSAMSAVNTLGTLLGDPTFVADIRPAPGTRGYAYKNHEGEAVAAMWATIDDVDLGLKHGPVMRVKFSGALPKLIDLMGREWPMTPSQDGVVELQLTSAPLFLCGGDPKQLAEDLGNAEVLGAGATLKIGFEPNQQDGIRATVQNLLSREQNADLVVDDQSVAVNLAPLMTESYPFNADEPFAFGKLFSWNKIYGIEQAKKTPLKKEWDMDYFYAPHVEGEPDWNTIPVIPITNFYRPVINQKQTPGGQPGDISAQYQIAWNKDALYLRVEAEDNRLNLDNPDFWNSPQAQKDQLYLLDGCLELYLDGAANGRLGNDGFDLDDYRYDFCVGNPEGASGPGMVCRLREPHTEYALGVDMPTQAEAAQKIVCEFTRISDNRYAYTIQLKQRYLEPLRLEESKVAGFALYLHDQMDDGLMGNKGMSLATKAGAHPNNKPSTWPLMYLSGESAPASKATNK